MSEKLTKEDRERLDKSVLQAALDRGENATYVLRNNLDWPGKPWHRRGVTTSMILRACRRLERAGLIEERPTPYITMLSWRITPAGRAALEKTP